MAQLAPLPEATLENHKPAIERLEKLYSIPDQVRVRNFLQQHSNLVQFLFEAHAQVEKYFGRKTRIVLRVMRDREAEQSNDELVAFIMSPFSIDESLSKLDKLDDDWFLDQTPRVGLSFNFSLGYL